MRYLLGLDLNDIVPFKSLSVDFKETLTYVRGCNLDADPANPTGNGAGKTRMFSAIANMFYRSTPLSLKKRAKKELLSTKSSSTGIILRPAADGPEYEIIQTAKGYTIYEDGEDLKVRTTPLAEAFIAKLWPLSEIEFYSTCYVSTQRPYLLQQDTDSNRLQHFIDLFQLDQYSRIRDYFAVKQRTISDNEIKLSVLEQRLVAVRKKMKESSCSISAEDYKSAKKEYSGLADAIDSLQKKRFAVLSQIKALENLKSVEQKLDKLRAKYTFKKAPDAVLKQLRAQRADAKAWDTYEEQLAHVQKLRAKIEAKLEAFEAPSLPVKRLKQRKKKLAGSIEALESAIEKMEEAKDQQDAIEADLRAVEKKYAKVCEAYPKASDVDLEYDYEADIGAAKSSMKLEALLEHDHDEGKCPTCLSDLDMQNIYATVKQAKKNLPRFQAFQQAQKLIRQLLELKSSLKSFKFDAKAYKQSKSDLSQAEKKLEATEEALKVWASMEALQEQLAELALPEKPDCERPSLSADDLEESIELCREVQKYLEAKNALLKDHEDFQAFKSEKAVRKALAAEVVSEEKLSKEIAALDAKRSGYAESVSQYEQYLNTVKIYKKERTDTEAEIAKLKPSVEDKKLVSILLKAYGAKGLRAQAADNVCKLYQTNLNHYRDLIFAEPFEFTVNAGDAGISILVDRNNGKPNSVSDVRNLSGAESNSFRLLSVAALLPLMPDSRRVNFLVLDEPTSHQDEASRRLFNERYLPVMRELVPSIFVITPHRDDVSPNSGEWVVHKHKGESVLKVVN